MGSTMLGDFTSGALQGESIAHASFASGAATSVVGGSGSVAFWRAPQNIVIDSAFWEPTGASFSPDASATASYRTLSLIDQGAAGAGTTVLASWNAQTSVASFNQQALTLNPSVESGEIQVNAFVQGGATVAKGHIVAAQVGGTVGGANATDTALPAGQFEFNYRPA